MPRQFAQFLSVIIGDLVYFLPTIKRRTILSNLHHVYPDKPMSRRRRQARTSCRRMVEMYLFKLALPHFSEGRLDKTLIATQETIELLKNYVDPNKPVIGVSIHNSMMEACTLIPRCLPFDNPEIGLLYWPLNKKKIVQYVKDTRSRNGITLIDRLSGLHEARELVKNNNWMIFVFDQNVGDAGYLTFFLGRAATTAGFHQILSHDYDADVLSFYGERTGFWEGKLHVEKISGGGKEEPVILQANHWLEEKLTTDERFSANWMWIHNRWEGQNHHSQNLNLKFPNSLLDETKKYNNWKSLPKNNRIWIRMPEHLGEVIKWIPLIKRIGNSREDAEITLLSNRKFNSLLEALQVADHIICIPKRNTGYYQKFLKLKTSYPDTYYQLTDSFVADLESRLINAPRRYGICYPRTNRPLLTHSFKVDPGWDERKTHQVELWEDFFRYFGLQGEVDYSPLRLAPGSDVINPLRCLQTQSLNAPYFGLICGAGDKPEKCWPVDYWVECIAGLMDLYPDSNICLFGTSADLPVSRQIIEQFEPGSIHDFTGSTTLMQFVMALNSCSVVISNDCGGLHLANALGVPTVGLYGVTNPVNTKPVYDTPLQIVQPINCPKHGGVTSAEICLSQVLEAISELVKQPEPAPKEASLIS